MNPADLFAAFDPAEVLAIQKQESEFEAEKSKAKAHKAKHRHQMRRANAEKHLCEILPPVFDLGESWHVISRGDIDALSYLRFALGHVTHFDHVLLSTWCIAKPDMEEIAQWLDTGRIDQLHMCAGEIFPSQYGDEYEYAHKLIELYGAKLTIAKNHSKVTLAANAAQNYFLTIESSANVNTNPRIEQTTITNDAELYAFYLDFYSQIKSIDKGQHHARSTS
jgi:hypothetical protein